MYRCAWINFDGVHGAPSKGRRTFTEAHTLVTADGGTVNLWTPPAEKTNYPGAFWLHRCPSRWWLKTSTWRMHEATKKVGEDQWYLFGTGCTRVEDPSCFPQHKGRFSWNCANGDLTLEDTFQLLVTVSPGTRTLLADPEMALRGRRERTLLWMADAFKDVERTMSTLKHPGRSVRHRRNVEAMERGYRFAEELGLTRGQVELGVRMLEDKSGFEEIFSVIEIIG